MLKCSAQTFGRQSRRHYRNAVQGCNTRMHLWSPFRTQGALLRGNSSGNISGSTSARPKLLFTPGPLTTSAAVKARMTQDMGSRDGAFLAVVKRVRERLLRVANTSQEQGYECIIVQGAGSMALEAMLGSAIPREASKVLIVSNGSYGDRQELICQRLGVPYECVRHPWNMPVTAQTVLQALETPGAVGVTHVSMVHHETTAGVVNPIWEVGQMLSSRYPQLKFIVDSMSAFGAYPTPVETWGIHYMCSSANKCIEGVPGFSFVIAHRETMLAAEGSARSLVLDLQDQWRYLERSGQFRFTPPVQSILAYDKALDEWEEEGGVDGRAARYRENFLALANGMEEMGFRFFVPDAASRGYIITTFQVPEKFSEKWDFNKFYDLLNERGFVIYPSSLAKTESDGCPAFRVGNIGQLFPEDVRSFLDQVGEVLQIMGLPVPLR